MNQTREIDIELSRLFEKGNIEEIKSFIKSGKADNGVVLWYACYYGNFEIVDLLFKSRIDLKKDVNGSLNIALRNGHIEIARYLIKTGNINTVKAIEIASEYGYTEIVKELLESVENLKDELGWALYRAVSNKHKEIAIMLIELGVASNYRTIYEAVRSGDNEMLKLLLKKREELTDIGYEVFMEAIDQNNIEAIKLLIDAVADIQENGDVTIAYAAEHGSTDMVKLFLEAGADAKANEGCWSACTCAKYDSLNNDSVITSALEGGNIDTIKLLIEKGADLKNCADFILPSIVSRGRIDILKILIDADVKFTCYAYDSAKFMTKNEEIKSMLVENERNLCKYYANKTEY